MSLRQRLASDLARGNLTHSPIHETAADRIGALGLSDRLGAAMWRVLAEHDASALKSAVFLLAKLVGKGKRAGAGRRTLLINLCWLVVQERLADKCRRCQGRGFIYNAAGIADACVSCGGTRIGRHSDTERMRLLGWSKETYRKWEAEFAHAHEKLANAEARVSRQISRQLERGGLR